MYNQKPIDPSIYGEEWHKNNKFWVYGDNETGKRRTEGTAPYLIASTFGFNSNVLDVGSGRGYLVKFLREFGMEAIGVDYSKWTVENRVDDNIIFGNMTNLKEWPDNNFDLVISRENMEHLTIEQADKAFKEMIRICRVGGHMYLTIWLNFRQDAKDDEVLRDPDNKDDTHISVCTRKFWENKFQTYVDSGIIQYDKEKEQKLDWKGYGRVFVFKKLKEI